MFFRLSISRPLNNYDWSQLTHLNQQCSSLFQWVKDCYRLGKKCEKWYEMSQMNQVN